MHNSIFTLGCSSCARGLTALLFTNIYVNGQTAAHHWKLFLIALLLLASGFVGCNTSVPQVTAAVDRSFLTGKPCAAPCWYGLELDKAEQEAVLATLRGLEFVDESSIRIHNNSVWPQFPIASEIYFCSKSDKRNCNTAVFSEEKLKMLWLSVEYDLTLNEVVQQLGKPDYISYSPYRPESRSCTLQLYWPTSHIFVSNDSETDDSICQALKAGKGLDPNIKVTGIVYAVSETFVPGYGVDWPGFIAP